MPVHLRCLRDEGDVRQDYERAQKFRLELQRAEEGYLTACISHAEHLLKNAEEMSARLEKRCASPERVAAVAGAATEGLSSVSGHRAGGRSAGRSRRPTARQLAARRSI